MLLYLFFEIFHLFFPYMSLHSKTLRAKRARSGDVRE